MNRSNNNNNNNSNNNNNNNNESVCVYTVPLWKLLPTAKRL